MILSISQPAYLPWLGYFDRIAKSDVHVVLDHVQFEKRSFTSRNRILTPNGPLWLSVPVKTKGLYQQVTIDKLEIDNRNDWRSSHWKNIKQAYSTAPYFKEFSPVVEAIYERPWHHLNDLCQFSTNIFLSQLEIDRKLILSTTMQARSLKAELIVDLAVECGAKTYISGPFGREYLEANLFKKAQIEVCFHDYKHPCYRQRPMGKKVIGPSENPVTENSDMVQSFEPYMSILDLLFNEGKEAFRILSSYESLSKSWR